MSYEDQISNLDKTDLHHELDKIMSYLSRGKMFHYNNSFGLRMLALRGFANLHDKESICDYKHMICIKKIAGDKLEYCPHIDFNIAHEFKDFKIESMNDFKNSFKVWEQSETELEKCITKALKCAAEEDIQLYKELICLADEVQQERMRADMIYKRCELGQWGGHDLARISKDIHCHLESHDDLDFTLS